MTLQFGLSYQDKQSSPAAWRRQENREAGKTFRYLPSWRQLYLILDLNIHYILQNDANNAFPPTQSISKWYFRYSGSIAFRHTAINLLDNLGAACKIAQQRLRLI
ncbi:hypothetical protein N824_02335 [Pedobacter sp. V48]|nr:hypothetical protein N824_02335 [Pedobacter sp. V48]